MTVKEIIRPIPGVRRLSLFRQRLGFAGSASFWERNYKGGGTSGAGSYGMLARAKAELLNAFVQERKLESVIEFGCGDGNQLSLAKYPTYIGLDVSPTAIALCKDRFAQDNSKSFFLYDGEHFVDHAGLFTADLAISLDVIYHLVENNVYDVYIKQLFAAAQKYVIIYSTDSTIEDTGPHVRHRQITPWIAANYPDWRLIRKSPGPRAGMDSPDFFVYERLKRQP
jgi:cyclopropane fatty-acyl-phospholipid synthase-like methyltransferase